MAGVFFLPTDFFAEALALLGVAYYFVLLGVYFTTDSTLFLISSGFSNDFLAPLPFFEAFEAAFFFLFAPPTTLGAADDA